MNKLDFSEKSVKSAKQNSQYPLEWADAAEVCENS